jgi:Raf kinase inhibitor-like YbhB/YbcL family protein
MKLTSKDFKHNDLLDTKFSFRGKNISPHLKWTDIPSDTKSLVLSCNDPDAPAGDWIHWLVINIPPHITEIPQGGPVPGFELQNDSRQIGYSGPAPPSGIHRYFFKIYALNIENLKDVSKKNFKQKIQDYVIESAEIIGRYEA